MITTPTLTLRLAASALLAVGLTVVAAPAQAKQPDLEQQDPFGPVELPAGDACDFPLTYSGTGDLTATSTHGNVTKVTGYGSTLTLTNADTGETITLESAPFMNITTALPSGEQHIQAHGSNLIILFPTDVPAGPSTTLYQGHVNYTIDTDFIWTIRSSSGPTVDVCAALS
ncbi:hypothetical protein [Cellulomonas sp. Leaf395]|uniref:hypothetical protein n=1 Tax=Cellulomonas sp. Leaf395 TaxID=1736362 RepID=UPI0006FB0AE7|nr:hypothetical protein [Cellulomonas sp. Leaf395]KQS99866.1 hypothetical protein ASG23_11145 [Cellulomonas sp. Leaf395]